MFPGVVETIAGLHDNSVISYGDFADTNTLLIRKFFMDDQRSIILLESPLSLESYLFNTKNMTAAMSTKRHTRPKVKPTIKPTFDSDLAENRIKKYVRKRNCYNKICHQSNIAFGIYI